MSPALVSRSSVLCIKNLTTTLVECARFELALSVCRTNVLPLTLTPHENGRDAESRTPIIRDPKSRAIPLGDIPMVEAEGLEPSPY